MKNYIKFTPLLAALIFAGPTLAETSDMITVKPGQWIYEFSYEFGGQVVDSQVETYCLTEAESRRTVESLVEDVKADGSCKISNLIHSEGALSADAVCLIKDIGMEAAGTISATYNDVRYDVKANAIIDMGRLKLPATATAKAKWVGACKPSAPSGE